MELLTPYLPTDRRQAIARGQDLPDRTIGSALFADVSGFTPLTESLVQDLGPKRGAEELTRQLNLIFDALIAEVNRYDGSVIVFGGDAITCWFDRDSGQWATACGLAMQHAMQPFAFLRTPSGETASLAMKAVIATGPIRRFRVGDPRIQLMDVLAGTTLDDMSAAEHHTRRGEVVLSPKAAAQLGESVVISEWREGEEGRVAVVSGLHNLVTPDSRPVGSQPEALTEAQLRPWLLPPVYERLIAGQAQFLAEIRPTAVLFLKFGGIDYEGDEAAGAKLDAYLRWVQTSLARYEGYMLQVLMGDKGSHLYATFGAPLAHDDDPARAVAAALELCTPTPELDFIRDVHIGVSRGRMWSGAYGSVTRRTYGVLGDAVNLAARLMAKAEPGQVLVSQTIVEATEQAYVFESIGLVPIKGKQAPLPVFQALARRAPSAQKSVSLYHNRLVGREAELVQMENLLGAVFTGEGQILRVEGAPGLGKSHLAAEFAERAERRGAWVVVGACQSITQDSPYTPWQQIFHTLFGLADGGSPEAHVEHITGSVTAANPDWLVRLPLLGDLLGLHIPDNATTATFDPRLRQEALFALAVDLIQLWAQTQPLVVMIEDAHWMDEASLGLTLALGRVLAKEPVLLALVQRPSMSGDKPLLPELNRLAYYHQLELGELSPEGIATLVVNRLQGQPSALALSLLQTQAQGNPFFTEELVDALRESGKVYRQQDRWLLSEGLFNALRDANCLTRAGDAAGGEWTLSSNAQLSAVNLGIPDSVHGVVLSRIDRLPEPHKLTLKVGSVIGSIFALGVLDRAHPAYPGRDTLQSQLQTFEARDFARLEVPPPHTAYIFKHNITQEVVYETLLEAQQRALHLAVGTVLEELRPEAVEQLAYHFSRAGQRDKALLYLDQAARKAQREYANETALNYYSQALALEGRWGWRKGQVEVLHILGRRDEELAALHTLEAGPGVPAFEAAYLWGQYYEAVGDYAQAQAAVARALTATRATAHRLDEARCLSQLGLIARRQGDYERAKNWYTQALTLFPEAAHRSEAEAHVLAQALNGLGIVHRQQGNLDDARRCYEEALTVSRARDNRQGEAEALDGLGGAAYYQRNFTEALGYYRQALEIRQAIGDRAGEGTSLSNLAKGTRDAGDYEQARAYFVEALAIQQATGNRWEEINIWNDLGILYQELGDLAQAQDCLQRGLRLSQEIGDQAGQAYILANLGPVARDRGDIEAATRLLNEGLALAQAQADKYLTSYFLSHLGIASLRAGRANQATEQAKAALSLRQELGLRLWTTADLTTLAAAHLAIKELAQARAYVRQALTILDECAGEGPEFPQQDYFICYQVLTVDGQTEAARRALHAAHALVMARAHKITDPALRQSFLERVPLNAEIMRAARRLGLD